MTVAQFAAIGHFSNRDGTIRKYHKSWDEFAAANKLPLSKHLVPGQEVDFDNEKLAHSWEQFRPSADAGADHRVGNDKAPAYAQEAAKAGTTKGMAIRVGSNKKALEAAILADPDVAKAAFQGLQKRNEKLATETKLKAAASALEKGNQLPNLAPTYDDYGPIGNAMDYAVEEAERREAIRTVLDLTSDILAASKDLAENYGHTGVEDEVTWLLEAASNLTEAQWAINGFIVQTDNIETK